MSGQTPALHSVSRARASTPPLEPAFRTSTLGPRRPDTTHTVGTRAGLLAPPPLLTRIATRATSDLLLKHLDTRLATYV